MSQFSNYHNDDCGYSSSSSSSVDSDHGINNIICANGSVKKSDNLLERTVLHLDVDCFYCQCHEIERPELQNIPFAVGQKHIIVTCNYPARAVGVSKLMLKTEAIKKCPNLIILDGSDLEPYRLAGRRVYDAFRKGITLHFGTYLRQKQTNNHDVRNSSLQVKKGGMDEMYADVTAVMDLVIGQAPNMSMKNISCFNASHKEGETLPSFQPFVYGDGDSSTERIVITEDQSGASSETTHLSSTSFRPEGGLWGQCQEKKEIWGDTEEREECARRLLAASSIGELVRHYVKEQTGFRACIGVSVSPMLAKIASDIKVNITRIFIMIYDPCTNNNCATQKYQSLYLCCRLPPNNKYGRNQTL
jgi:DNA polymerase iota